MSVIYKLVEISMPVEIIGFNKEGITYSHVASESIEKLIGKTLSGLIKLSGIRKKTDKNKFKFETHVDPDKRTITYFYESQDLLGHEIDKSFFEQTHKMVSTVVNTVNTVNQHYDKGDILTPEFDASIDNDFELVGSSIKYKDRVAASVVNDILNLLPVLSHDAILASNGKVVQLDRSIKSAPPIKTHKLLADEVELEGKVAGILSIPERHIRIQTKDGNYRGQIIDFVITQHCLKFAEIRLLPEKAEVKIELIKSTATLQYNIKSFEVIGDQEEKYDLFAS